jgi:aminopeptidase N
MWGKAKAFEYANGWKKIIQNDVPIVPPRHVNQEGSSDMYFKGALMIHTLRNIINSDDKWFAYLKEFYQTFKGKNTNTDEVVAFWNKKTGLELRPFFTQYLKFLQIPTFEYKIEGGKFQYRFKADVKDFRMPIVVKFGSTEMILNASTEWETIIFDARGGNNSLLNEPFSVRTDLFFVNVERK